MLRAYFRGWPNPICLPFFLSFALGPKHLVAPYRAIVRYYRCDTPYRAILFKEGENSPNMVRYPPLVLSFTQAHQCDTPFCNISRDNCAIPHKKQARESFAILSLQVSRDMKSIAPGPLSQNMARCHPARVATAERLLWLARKTKGFRGQLSSETSLCLESLPHPSKIRIKKAAQRVSFRAGCPADVHADIPADVRGQKLRSGPRNPGKKQAHQCGHP